MGYFCVTLVVKILTYVEYAAVSRSTQALKSLLLYNFYVMG